MRRKSMRRKVRNFTEDLAEEIAEDKRVEAAAKEVRRRWSDARERITDVADVVATKATEAAEELPSLDHVQTRVADVGGVLGANLVRLSTDLADASRGEADRVIRAVQDEAERTRLETTEAERKSRVRALVGWTVFGVVAGYVLANTLGGKEQPEEEDAYTVVRPVEEGDLTRETPVVATHDESQPTDL